MSDSCYSNEWTEFDSAVFKEEEGDFLEVYERMQDPLLSLVNSPVPEDGRRGPEVERLIDEFEENVEEGLDISLRDRSGDSVRFEYSRTNNSDPRYTKVPTSSGMLKSEDENLGLRVIRSYEDDYIDTDLEPVPEEWRELSDYTWSQPDPREEYLIKEHDFVSAVNREEGINDFLKDTGWGKIARQDFKIIDHREDPDIEGIERETAIIYDWKPGFWDSDPDLNKIKELGKYAAKLDALGLVFEDRRAEEVLVSGKNVYECDPEFLKYCFNPSIVENGLFLLQHQFMESEEDIDNPRFKEEVARAAYRDAKRELGDLSNLIPEKITEWDLSKFDDQRLLLD